MNDMVKNAIASDIPKRHMNSVTKVLYRITVVTLLTVAFVGIPLIGVEPFARAGDMKREIKEQVAAEVAKEVTAKIDPVIKSVDALEKSFKEAKEEDKAQRQFVSGLIRQSVSGELCRAIARRGKETDTQERIKLSQTIGDLKETYKSYANRDFQPDDCSPQR